MDISSVAGQVQPGVRLIDMDEVRAPLDRVQSWARRMRFRREQVLQTLALCHGARLWIEDRAKGMAFIERGRAVVAKAPTAVLSLIEANAVRVRDVPPMLASPPVPCQWFAPHKGEPHGYVFYVHGGSFIAERSPRLTAMVAQFAARANARVFAPDYRLAPEHACPAAVEDVLAAYRWFREAQPDEPIVALADSAGSAILLAALQQARDEGVAMPDGVVLLSPWVDLSLQSWSVVAASLTGTTGTSMEALALMAHLYLQGQPATDPVASPLYGDFSGFPPMLIHASKGDILYDDATRLADRIRDVGGDLTVRLWASETHVWERTDSKRAKESIDLAADFIQRCLS
jgi:monoterpene epsilon-lactone hydrolase